MYLEDLIKHLEEIPKGTVIKHGFDEAMSYRGNYSDLAFEPKENVLVDDMLRIASDALGNTFTGYKGGEYTMNSHTDCYIAEYGCSGDSISEALVSYWKENGK